MALNKELLRTQGFNEDEIQHIQERCDAVEKANRINHHAALVTLNGETQWVCGTIARILDDLRPGCWIDRPKHLVDSKKPGDPIKVELIYDQVKPGGPSGEHLWARRISNNTAKIESIPFLIGKSNLGNLACGDLVRINDENEITAILEHVARTRLIVYGDSDKQSKRELKRRYAKVRAQLEPHDIDTEGIMPGICTVSVPNDIDDAQLDELAEEVEALVISDE